MYVKTHCGLGVRQNWEQHAIWEVRSLFKHRVELVIGIADGFNPDWHGSNNFDSRNSHILTDARSVTLDTCSDAVCQSCLNVAGASYKDAYLRKTLTLRATHPPPPAVLSLVRVTVEAKGEAVVFSQAGRPGWPLMASRQGGDTWLNPAWWSSQATQSYRTPAAHRADWRRRRRAGAKTIMSNDVCLRGSPGSLTRIGQDGSGGGGVGGSVTPWPVSQSNGQRKQKRTERVDRVTLSHLS